MICFYSTESFERASLILSFTSVLPLFFTPLSIVLVNLRVGFTSLSPVIQFRKINSFQVDHAASGGFWNVGMFSLCVFIYSVSIKPLRAYLPCLIHHLADIEDLEVHSTLVDNF